MQARYAKLFVDTSLRHAELLQAAAAIVDGRVDGWTVTTDEFEIDVRANKWTEGDGPTLADRFLAYPITVEVVDEGERGEREGYVQLVANIMHGLHAGGASVVAACEFEHELPGGGALLQQS